MKTYDIYNPSKATRIIYDGIEGSQRSFKLTPGTRLQNVPLADHIVQTLVDRNDELKLTARGDHMLPPSPMKSAAPTVGPKPKIIVDGMYGIGDNLHQRAAIRELMKTHEVWLITCHAAIWHDMLKQGLHLSRKTTNLRTQAKILEREKDTFPDEPLPSGNVPRIKIWYKKEAIDQYGTIAGTLMSECGVFGKTIDFSMPVPREWIAQAQELINKWKPKKPLLIYRPIVRRKEWNGENRNPDPQAYAEIFKSIRDKYFVVSIADLKKDEEWIVGEEQEADVKIHDGSLHFETIAGLFARADLVYCNAGMAPVLAQAVGAPSIVVYGGRECFRTTQAAGAHLAPTLGIDPITPCDCQSERHGCDKTIDVPAALSKVAEFVATTHKQRTLIFATTYVDSPDREKLTKQWIKLTTELNPECDILLVDSASPLKEWKDDLPSGVSIFDFGDNVGHLSRKGRDGWGRAFCYGLQYGVDHGYTYVAHIEGDSLLRTPVAQITRRLNQESKGCASIAVKGMKGEREYPTWIETGLMVFTTDYLVTSHFIEHYDWPNRKESPTPEVIVRQLVQDSLVLLPLKGERGDKNQITKSNVKELDWVTHCHVNTEVYDVFLNDCLGIKEPKRKVRINLGCGENILDGWENHDADVDISKRLPYPDDHADFIFCEHCVEHIPYPDAVAFFKECHRVLKPGGTVRITVPSIEQVYKNSGPAYWKFATKFGNENSLRGAMANIMFKHGHQTCWTRALLEASLFYAGFDEPVHCETHKSQHPDLNGVEGHHHIIGEEFNSLESLSFEGTKAGGTPVVEPVITPRLQRVAVVCGGGPDVEAEIAKAKEMYGGSCDFFVINDMIPRFPGECVAITLHPSKLKDWLPLRGSYPAPKQVWAHRKFAGVSNVTEDWMGSSGLFAIKVAMQLGYAKIVLCGVPMTDEKHFVRGEAWTAVAAFKKAWVKHKDEIAPFVRSFSGWTAEQFGRPQ